ncbi:rho guanine nucleotide exchange factor 10-like isoform X4 [Polyodon spathula]|uniref:rho guanine nucleotide exchange factor 10-like isoform X4 n=1 Tax=Polyodon spathula TaxID=7913 RepID=UPI001B7E2C62|nr:rho guanine nucleotide exchange factor 10-like isoform X4 [Polyodon spathula]
MDVEEFPPPPPEVMQCDLPNVDEDEDDGELFEFDDSGDEIHEADQQPPAPPLPDYEVETKAKDTNSTEVSEHDSPSDTLVPPAAEAARGSPLGKVNPYSVVDIAPLQEQSLMQEEEELGQEDAASARVPSGYSVPVPCGYAVPSNVPLILPAYSTPVIIRHLSVDEEVTVHDTSPVQDSDDRPAVKRDDALARWVADPANTAWMENPDEVIYDDVPRENSDSTTDADEMIYDDVELGEEGGDSSPENGWSSSEFESYDEQSDTESKSENGIPNAFLRGKSQKHKTHMQKLMKAAKDGTKDGLEKTKAAVKRGRSFIKTKSFIQDRKSVCLEEEPGVFIEVDCLNTEPVMMPMPEGLTQQQVVRRYILGSILESEKNYLDALKRILEQYEKPLSETDPKLISDRKLKMMFYRVKEILQCHSLFQIALASRVAEWDSSEMIGDVFVASFSKSMVLDAYSEYVNNFSTAMGVVKKTCETKPAFLEFLKHCQDSSCDRSTLYGLMMKPIQRFPQFILLLQDMLKNTPKGHPDRLPLQMALTELETLAEKLNERKREADQRCEIKQIAKAMNERYLNKLLSSGSRYLIRSDDMVETVYNEKGEVIKTKERRLFLLSDVLMCATVNIRSTCEGSGIVPHGQKYLLKWSVPLSHVDVVEFGGNEERGENSRHPAQHSGEKVVLHAKPSKLYMGPGQLYQDLQNLMHDLNLVNQITQMIGNLKGNYQNLNQAVAHDWLSGLQRLIFKKEEEIRAADRCRIQLQLPGKHDKSGRPTFFTAVFNTFTPSIKQSWISSLQMAKLALEEENQQGWCLAEDDGNQIKKQKHPLLVRQIPVVMSKLQEFKVACAVHNPEPYCGNDNVPDSLSMGHGCLWIASCTNQMGQISIVTLHNSNPKVTECFNVESRIVSMVHITNEDKQEEPEACLDLEPAAGKATDSPTICLGMEEGSISVYKSSQLSKKVRLQHFFTPDKSTVMSLAYKSKCLYAGLVSGAIAIYTKTEDGFWNSDSPKILKLGVLPVKSILAMEDTIWASSGGHISIISTKTHIVESQLEAHQEEGMVISHMTIAGVGIWIAFSSGSTLRLFHTETLEHLQDINISTPIHNMLSGQQRVSVTSLLVCHGLLMVGTNLGIIVALPVPRLQGIPKVTGRGMVSYHAHSGPVKFLTVAGAMSIKKQRSTSVSSASFQLEAKDGEQRNDSPERLSSSLAIIKDKGVWLGDSTRSIAQQSNLSSSSGSLALSHLSLEHGPEEATIYELLNDPSFSNRGKRSKKMTVSSVLVVSGGLGHRRVNKKSKQQRQDETVSTIMVWQIPLLNI